MSRTMETTDLRRLALTFASRLKSIKDAYVERDPVVDVVALAALCREHVLLIGPPGTAKTGLLERFSTTLHGQYFSYLLTKFTEPAELFGAIDVRSFQNDSVYRVNTEGMLPKADIAFLDEIFNGSSAILNTLLTIINERKFYNGAHSEPCELITLLGATNEIPDDQMLLAFCDRFLFRCRLTYVSDESIDEVLDAGWRNERELLEAQPVADASGFSITELRTLQQAVTTVDLSAIHPLLVKILRSFRAEGITFSDRRAVKAQKAIAASALLQGRFSAEPKDLAVLTHLWANQYDEASIRRIIELENIPVSDRDPRGRHINEIQYLIHEWREQLALVESCEELRELLRRLGRLLNEVRTFHPDQATVQSDIRELQTSTIEALRSRCGEDGGFGV